MASDHEHYMNRCLTLARKGLGHVAPNPMVGAVVVYNDTIIGEGYHKRHGGPHAEVEAINSISDQSLLKECTLYVTLEPCTHHGKTPPCSDLIIRSKIPRVVFGSEDANEDVKGAGSGATVLRKQGVEVIDGILQNECEKLNKRFRTFHHEKRPYIILKWAETSDGFIARKDYSSKWISSQESRALVHNWRSEEAAIMVGTNTAYHDNPQLTARNGTERHPARIFLDRSLKVPTSHHLYDGTVKTYLFSEQTPTKDTATKLSYSGDLSEMLQTLYKEQIQSVLIEGGATLLQSFINQKLWDEARVFRSGESFGEGIAAPRIDAVKDVTKEVATDLLEYLVPA